MKNELTRIISLNRQINYYKEIRDIKGFETSILKLRKMEIKDGVSAGAYRIKGV